MGNLLEINNVVKTYGDYTALNNVSLHVPKGSVFGLLGPNGAGKTSLIRLLMSRVFNEPHTPSYKGKVKNVFCLWAGVKADEKNN